MKRLSVIILVAAIMMSEAIVFMIASQPARASTPWWNASWQHRRPITIGSRPENYQFQVVIPDNILKSDYPSIRFLWQVGQENYLLPYWIEKNDNQYNTTGRDIAWVRVLDNSNDSYSYYLGGNTIYMYYHNPSAVSAENGDNVFLEFTDFGGGANTDNWGVVTPAGGSVTWLNGSVKTTSTIGLDKTRLEWGEGQGVPVSEENKNRIIEVRMRAEVVKRTGLVLSGIGWNDVEEACIFDLNRFYFDGLSNSSEQDNKWYIARADLYGANGDNTLTIFYYGEDNGVYRNQVVTLGPKTKDWTRANGSDYVDKYNLVAWDVSTTSYFDWFFVRKWAATEPSVDVGSEETVQNTTGTASIRLATGSPPSSPYLWGIRKVKVTTSLVVNQGDNLRLRFLAQDNVTIENEAVIWSRTAPGAQVVTLTNLVVPHDLNGAGGNPAVNVKRVKLVLTDNLGNMILDNMAWYRVIQDDWGTRITWIILNWASHNSSQQDQLGSEISTIILNWASTPTTGDQHDFSQSQ